MSEQHTDKPIRAIIYFVSYTLFSAYNLVSGKFFCRWYPGMSTFQLLFYRGFSAVLVMCLWMGNDTKPQLFDNVNAEVFPPLAFRVFQGIFSQFIRYYSMSFFSLSMIGVIQKMAPVATVALAYMLLKERLSAMELILNFIAIMSSVLVSVGDARKTDSQYNTNTYIALVFLILNPVFIGMASVALRTMKKTSSETLTTWTNITQSIFMGIAIGVIGQSFTEYLFMFGWLEWLMLAGMTISVIGAQTTKLLAFQHQKASKLQVLGNLPVVYNFFFDIFLFDTSFSVMQYASIIITMCTFIADCYMTASNQSKAAAQKDAGRLPLPDMTASNQSKAAAHEEAEKLPLLQASADE